MCRAVRIAHMDAIRWFLEHDHTRTSARSAACPCKLQKADDIKRERFLKAHWPRIVAETQELMVSALLRRDKGQLKVLNSKL